MSDERKNKLINLGTDVLADALLKLADNDVKADSLVERLTSDPSDIIKKFRRKISGLKRRTRFIHWRESIQFAAELDELLEDIEEVNPEPCVGMALVASFFETDQNIVGNCDDSSGHIGDVYRFGACSLFAQYASGCQDKKKVLDVLMKTYSDDPYGVREGLIEKTKEMLGTEDAKNAIHFFEMLAEGEGDEYKKRHFQRAIESLARQTGDAKLFEKTRLESREEPGTAAFLDIATVYLENNEPRIALEWINRISKDETFMDQERRNLFQQIYGQLGDSRKEEEIAWLSFRKQRTLQTLENLLNIIGDEKREQVIHNEAGFIIDDGKTDYLDIQFLIDVRQFDEAEICIQVMAGTRTINGDYYTILLPMAKAMEFEGRLLTAYVIYRALLESILERKFYKGYPIAAKYLTKLDLLATEIDNWQDLGEHGMFHVWLNQVHGKKSSFWRNYRGE